MTTDNVATPAAIIVFDGACVLCSRWTRFVLRFDRAEHFHLAAMQTATGRYILQQHGIDPDDPSTFLVLDDRRAYRDSSALVHVLRQCGGLWRWMARLLRCIPLRWRDQAYRSIAHNRYRWFGRSEICVIPVAAQAHRFLR